MKLKSFILFSAIVFLSSYRAQTTYYLTGRPFTVERNNAMLTTGETWKLELEYLTQEELDKKGLPWLSSYTDSVSRQLAKNSEFKENWYSEFVRQASEEEKKQNEIRLKVTQEKEFKELTAGKAEVFLLFEKKKKLFKKYYLVSIVTQLKEAKGFEVVGVLKYRTKKGKIQWLKVSSPCLPFELVQNALVDPC